MTNKSPDSNINLSFVFGFATQDQYISHKISYDCRSNSKKTLSSIWRQGAALLLDPKYDQIGARIHVSCLVSTSPGSCWPWSFRCFAWNAGLFEWTFRVTLIEFIREQKPDSYVVGENPAINNEKISRLLVLLVRVDLNEFSQTLAHRPIWCSLWFEEICSFECRSFWCQIEASCRHSQLFTTCNDRSVKSDTKQKWPKYATLT